MAYVVTSLWRAKDGEEDAILDVIKKVMLPSRREPGCVMYQAQRSPNDPHVFFLYEQYISAGGYETHTQTEHFEQWVKGVAIPKLESRQREFYETIETLEL